MLGRVKRHRFLAVGACAAVLAIGSAGAGVALLHRSSTSPAQSTNGCDSASASTAGSAEPHFVPTRLPRLPGSEAPRPYATRRSTGPSEWRLLYVRGDGQPEPLYETGRFLMRADWSPDGRSVDVVYETNGLPDSSWQKLSFEEILRNYAYWRGLTSFDVSATPVSSREELLLTGFPLLYLSPDHTHIAVLRDEGMHRTGVYVVDRRGCALRLEGAGDHAGLCGWLPDGSGVLIRVPAACIYMVPLTGDSGTRIADFVEYPAWSPGGERLAYLASGDLFVLDRATGTSRQIASNVAWRQVRTRPRLQWAPGGDAIILGGDLIDAATGQVLVSLGYPYGSISSEASRDGRYFAVAEDPSAPAGWACDPGTSRYVSPEDRDNRIHVYDRVTGETRLIQDCGQGFAGPIRWMPDDRHLIASHPAGWPPDSSSLSRSLSLIDVTNGSRTPLIDRKEKHAQAFPSPDGSRLIVTGERLRVYTADGGLIREITPPSGFDVAAAAWSPDGSSFVYILGPAGFEPIYP